MFNVLINIEMKSLWVKQSKGQKGGGKTRGWKYQWSDIHRSINGST